MDPVVHHVRIGLLRPRGAAVSPAGPATGMHSAPTVARFGGSQASFSGPRAKFVARDRAVGGEPRPWRRSLALTWPPASSPVTLIGSRSTPSPPPLPRAPQEAIRRTSSIALAESFSAVPRRVSSGARSRASTAVGLAPAPARRVRARVRPAGAQKSRALTRPRPPRVGASPGMRRRMGGTPPSAPPTGVAVAGGRAALSVGRARARGATCPRWMRRGGGGGGAKIRAEARGKGGGLFDRPA